MSQGNVELARRYVDALDRHDVEALVAVCDPEVEFRSFFSNLLGGTLFDRGVQQAGQGAPLLGAPGRAALPGLRRAGCRRAASAAGFRILGPVHHP